MPSVLFNQKEQELLNMKTVTLKNNRRWVQDLECSVLHITQANTCYENTASAK